MLLQSIKNMRHKEKLLWDFLAEDKDNFRFWLNVGYESIQCYLKEYEAAVKTSTI